MVALHSLSTASTLLQQIAAPTASSPAGTVGAVGGSSNTLSIAQIASGEAVTSTSAEKSVSSAIFNAVTNLSEEQENFVKAFERYVDDNYMNLEERFAFVFATASPDTHPERAIQGARDTGKQLMEQVRSDPASAYKLFQQIGACRPDVTSDGIMGFLVAALNNRNSKA